MYPSWNPPPPQWGRPTGPSVAWAVVLWVVAVGALAGAVIAGIIAFWGLSTDRHMDDHGVTTTATVVSVDDVTVCVEFTTEDDRPATAVFTWWPDEFPAVDDRIEITYDPDDPTYAVQAGSNEDQIMGAIGAVVAVGALGAAAGATAGAILVHRARGRAARTGGYY